MANRTGIVRKIIFNTLVISIAALMFVGIVWIGYVALLFKSDRINGKIHILEDRKNLVKNEIDKNIDFIKIIKSKKKENFIDEKSREDYITIVKNMKFGNNWKVEFIKYENNNYKNERDKKIIEEIKNTKNNEGKFFYYFDAKQKTDKLIFAKKSEILKVVIFAEVPVKDLEIIDIEKGKKQYKDMMIIITIIILTIISATFVIVKVEGKIIRQIKNELTIIMDFFEKESGRINTEYIYLEEFKKISLSVNEMLDKKEKSEKELIKAKEDAESANIAKSKFISNTSHEIRTPMNGVIGTIELMKDTELNEEQQMFLKIMEDSADHLSNLLNDVLDMAKIESGKVTLDMGEFIIEEEIKKTVSSFFIQGIKNGVEMITYIDKNVPKYVIGDIGKINQIIINILGNAVKFTQKGSIFLGVEKNREENDEIELKIVIEDTGIGIPEEKIEEIFKPFEQIDMSYTKIHQGTGLGLAISKNLAELMKGKIEVKSSLWKGTKFEIYLRVKDSAKNFIEKKEIEEELKNIKAVVADNCKKGLEIYKKILEEEGSYIEVCETEKELMKKIKMSNCIDLIIIKKEIFVKMDNSEINKIKSVCDNNIIIIANIESTERGETADENKKIRYLKKPFTKKEFISIIKEVLDKSEKKERCAVKVIEKTERRFKILIAEDNDMNKITIEVMFQKMYGVNPIFAENGEECIEISEKERPDIIFMDIQMPVMNGVEATLILKQHETTKNIPVIGVTAYAYQDEIERFKKSGMETVLTKPLKMEKIREVIEKYLPEN